MSRSYPRTFATSTTRSRHGGEASNCRGERGLNRALVSRSHVDDLSSRPDAQAGVPRCTPHGLRHLHASLLLGKGLPLTAVSARLGHASPQITMSIYAHALNEHDAEAAELIGRIVAER